MPTKVPSECIGYVTGARRAALGNMEEEKATIASLLSSVYVSCLYKLIFCLLDKGMRVTLVALTVRSGAR